MPPKFFNFGEICPRNLPVGGGLARFIKRKSLKIKLLAFILIILKNKNKIYYFFILDILTFFILKKVRISKINVKKSDCLFKIKIINYYLI
jgi:hypothetical protein